MRKIIISCILIAAIFAYSYIVKNGNQAVLPSKNGSSANQSQPTTHSGTSSHTSTTGLRDGNYIGDASDAFYGTVQVQTTITSGKIIDIKFLQYPNDQGHSLEVSNEAMPLLTQEAIQNQSANVNIVTGATQTSQAFITSLQSALQKAQS